MSSSFDVAVIGAGLGGLSAAIRLAAKGQHVAVYEALSTPGGKAGQICHEGVWADTGPSVLTMPHVLDELLHIAGTSIQETLVLQEPAPSFRYLYADNCKIDVFPNIEQTLMEIEQTLGSKYRAEMENFLQYSKQIWDASAPHFLYGPAPTWTSIVHLAFKHLSLIKKVDPLRTMNRAINSYVSSPHLKMLLQRYATYNGSSPHVAPATLNCIAHVELALGGFGVQGGIHQIIDVLMKQARKLGVQFFFDHPVSEIVIKNGRVAGIVINHDRYIDVTNVIGNADAAHIRNQLLPKEVKPAIRIPTPYSMSGWTGLFKASNHIKRVAHTVVFPKNYDQEFIDIFDHKKPPQNPTVYLCAQTSCHAREGWSDGQAVFAMINTPPEPSQERSDHTLWLSVEENICQILRHKALMSPQEKFYWRRTPTDLATQFPGSRGAIYGSSSNNRFAAFLRPSNAIAKIPGLYLASGSVHPGGGMPLAMLSGKAAAEKISKHQ